METFLNLKRKNFDVNSDNAQPSTSQGTNSNAEISRAKKPKIYSFQTAWESEYFVVENDNKSGVLCLLCRTMLSGFRKANCERHYNTHHVTFCEEYPRFSTVRDIKLRELKDNLKREKNFFASRSNLNKIPTEVSFEISNIIAKHCMPYSSGEIVKECIVSAMKILTTTMQGNQRQMLIEYAKNIPLSSETVTSRVNSIAGVIKAQLLDNIAQCTFFSLALDESTEISSVSQLMCFVRYIQSDATTEEHFLCVLPLTGKTTGNDVYETLMQFLTSHNVNLSKLVSVVTDGAPSMIGKNKGLISNLIEDDRIPYFVHYHCLIHVEVLCSRLKSENNILEFLNTIVKIINYLSSRALNKRLLKVFLEDLQAPHSEFIVHADVRWLSRAKALAGVWEVFEEIKAFLVQHKIELFPMAFTDEFKITFSFMVDLFAHLNGLNLKLQSRCITVAVLYEEITAFQMKLGHFLSQIRKGVLRHFPELEKCLLDTKTEQCPHFVAEVIINLADEFTRRFEFLHVHVPKFLLMTRPLSFLTNDLSNIFNSFEIAAAELELIDMKSSLSMKHLYQQEDICQFWGSSECNDKFPLLTREAFKVLSMFGTTYSCESAFSVMNDIKNKKRVRITTEHLDECIRVAIHKGQLNTKELVNNFQSQGSH